MMYQPREFIPISISKRKEGKEKSSSKNPEKHLTELTSVGVKSALSAQHTEKASPTVEPHSAGFYGKAKGLPD